MVTASDSTVTATLSPRYGVWATQGAFMTVGDGSDSKMHALYIRGDALSLYPLCAPNKRKRMGRAGQGVFVQSSENAVTAVTGVAFCVRRAGTAGRGGDAPG